jgi:CRISPR/Cas system-associated protein Csm6
MLTDEERRRFAAYLKQEAESDKGMAAQLEKMHEQMQMAAPLKDALSKKLGIS